MNFRYNNIEKSDNGWIKISTSEYSNVFLIKKIYEYYDKNFINKDLYGRLNKLMKFFVKHNLIIDSISLLDKQSRAGKINNFLGRNSNINSILAEVNISTFKTNIKISIVKNKKGISNECLIIKNNEKYKNIEIRDYDKDIRYITNLVKKDKFDLDFLKSKLLELNTNEKNKEVINKIYNSDFNLYSKVKWDTCFVDIDNNYCSIRLVLQKKNILIEYSVKYYTTLIQDIKVLHYKDLSQYSYKKDDYESLVEALDKFNISYL